MQTSDKQRETEYLMEKHSWIGRTKEDIHKAKFKSEKETKIYKNKNEEN